MNDLVQITRLKEMVKKHRKKAGLTQSDLADMAGVGKTLIFDIEKGHQKIQLEKLLKILKVLNIELLLSPPELKG